MTSCQILVVDDDHDLRETVRDILELEGWTVATASNGEEALAYLHTHDPPQMILLDLSMPIMDGATFRLEQRQDPAIAPVPTVAFSAAAQIADKVRDLDFTAVLRKPLKMDALLDTVRSFCH
jgi:CheY-like chemotaxis protein